MEEQIEEEKEQFVQQNGGKLVEIDGSLHEGGGQMIRNSIALSTLFQQGIRLYNIRKNRPNPGINNQLLGGIQLMKKIAGCKEEMTKKKDLELIFKPSLQAKGGRLEADLGFGAINLAFQMIVPSLLFATEQTILTISGTTDLKWAPPSIHMKAFTTHLLPKMGIDIEYTVRKGGFSNQKQGVAQVKIKPMKERIKPIDLTGEKGEVEAVYIEVVAQNDEDGLFQEQILKIARKAIKHCIKKHAPSLCTPSTKIIFSSQNFTFITKKMRKKLQKQKKKTKKEAKIQPSLFKLSVILTGDKLFYSCNCEDQGSSYENQISKVLNQLTSHLQGNHHIDNKTADQILVYMALASGKSAIQVENNELTGHQKGMFYILEQFIKGFKYTIKDDIITIQGIGFFK